MRLFSSIALMSIFIIQSVSPASATVPAPPCSDLEPIVPAFAAIDEPPTILLETDKVLLNEWVPPDCLGWESRPTDLLVALAARSRADDIDALLARFARVSSLTEVDYWSITRQNWRRMFDAASALSEPKDSAIRADFATTDFVTGATLFVLHDDNDPVGPIVHEVNIKEVSEKRLVIATRNVAPGKVFGINVLEPNGLENITIIEHEKDDIWRYYTISRLQANIPNWLLPPDAAYVNRVVALYRHLSGVPTNGKPPIARDEDYSPG